MASVEETDIIEGAALRTQADEIIINRRFIVKDVIGPRPNRLINADQVSGIPNVGDPYPVVTDPMVFCAGKTTKPILNSSGQYEIMCIYEPRTSENQTPDDNGPATKSVGGSVHGVDTTNKVDREGNITTIVLERKNQPEEKDNLPKQTGVVTKQIPTFSLIFNRHEVNSPSDRARLFVGKMNEGTFEGFGEGAVLCTRIEGTTSNGGASYQVTYEFQVKDDENGWIPEVVYIDQDTDKELVDAAFSPPDDITLLSVNIYELADFNLLNLT